MEISITNDLKLENEILLVEVKFFQLTWMPNQHAEFTLGGYIDINQRYEATALHDSKIKIWLERENKKQILFWGYLVKIEVENVGKTKKIRLKAKSGSCKLDQHAESQSFQNINRTYAQVITQAVECVGGKVICESGVEQAIKKPLIQYEETIWEFGKRLASHLGTCLVPDIETSGKCFWFGMCKGNLIPVFSEKTYELNICRRDCVEKEICYDVESRDFYKIGDRTRFCGREMVICKVIALFKNGELIFKYSLKQKENIQMIYQNKFLGLGLKGTVIDTRKEQVKIALDIDGGDSTGDYFYDWYPETGNALYAVPEKDTRIILYFGSQDEREGFAIHSLPGVVNCRRSHKNKCFDTKEGNSVHLSNGCITLSSKQGHAILLENDIISICSVNKMAISAHGQIKINASRILISTSDELNICQG